MMDIASVAVEFPQKDLITGMLVYVQGLGGYAVIESHPEGIQQVREIDQGTKNVETDQFVTAQASLLNGICCHKEKNMHALLHRI
jgi:hypothetical protein